jgi:hypothetical protein
MRHRLIALLAFLAVCSPLAAAPAAQSSSAGGVTVTATPRDFSAAVWEFELAFNTHTQALNDEPAKAAMLIAGSSVAKPIEWQGDLAGGHHRKGVLRFKALDPRPQAVELRLERPGESAPRVFRWQLK